MRRQRPLLSSDHDDRQVELTCNVFVTGERRRQAAAERASKRAAQVEAEAQAMEERAAARAARRAGASPTAEEATPPQPQPQPQPEPEPQPAAGPPVLKKKGGGPSRADLSSSVSHSRARRLASDGGFAVGRWRCWSAEAQTPRKRRRGWWPADAEEARGRGGGATAHEEERRWPPIVTFVCSRTRTHPFSLVP